MTARLPLTYERLRGGWRLPVQDAILSMFSCGYGHRFQLALAGETTELRVDTSYDLLRNGISTYIDVEDPSNAQPILPLVLKTVEDAVAFDDGSLKIVIGGAVINVPANMEWDTTWMYSDWKSDIAIQSARGELAVGKC